jgi:uncharacterized phage protein (TIGR02220 family)
MEIIGFIKALRDKSKLYYEVWMPIILQFENVETKKIKVSLPLAISKNKYYAAINFGLSIFNNHVQDFSLSKCHSGFELKRVLGVVKSVEELPKAEIIQADVIGQEELTENVLPKSTKPSKKSSKNQTPDEVYQEIIDFLNECSGRKFLASTKSYRTLINSRLADGFTVEDFKKVIAIKSQKWLNTRFEDFLRPDTLFSNKFQGYLNETYVAPKTNLGKAYEQVSNASKLRDSQG